MSRKKGDSLATSAIELALLPGAEEVDEALLDEAVARINRIHTFRGLELAREIGEYLVETFFAGNVENFAAEKRHASWRALAERADLQISHSTLWYSVAILGQLRQLGSVGESLPVSHHRRLLPIRDTAAKKALARRAVDDGLTVTQLEKEIAKQRRKESRGEKRGRPRIPDYLKSLRRLPKLVEPLTVKEITAEDVEEIGADAMHALLMSLDEQLATLVAAKKEIETALKKARA